MPPAQRAAASGNPVGRREVRRLAGVSRWSVARSCGAPPCWSSPPAATGPEPRGTARLSGRGRGRGPSAHIPSPPGDVVTALPATGQVPFAGHVQHIHPLVACRSPCALRRWGSGTTGPTSSFILSAAAMFASPCPPRHPQRRRLGGGGEGYAVARHNPPPCRTHQARTCRQGGCTADMLDWSRLDSARPQGSRSRWQGVLCAAAPCPSASLSQPFRPEARARRAGPPGERCAATCHPRGPVPQQGVDAEDRATPLSPGYRKFAIHVSDVAPRPSPWNPKAVPCG